MVGIGKLNPEDGAVGRSAVYGNSPHVELEVAGILLVGNQGEGPAKLKQQVVGVGQIGEGEGEEIAGGGPHRGIADGGK